MEKEGGDYGNHRIGNRVYLAAGAKVIGKVTIGDDVMTGCNAVITKDIPAKKTEGEFQPEFSMKKEALVLYIIGA